MLNVGVLTKRWLTVHAVLLTLLAATGAGDGPIQASGPVGEAAVGHVADGYCPMEDRHVHWHTKRPHVWLGPMPQSCYNPTLGCYAGSRMMHRYPAFHGTYYRSAYNYRNYFDYPWHAGLHEPASLFVYGTSVPAGGEPLTQPLPPSLEQTRARQPLGR
jgi:hypothetical protein